LTIGGINTADQDVTELQPAGVQFTAKVMASLPEFIHPLMGSGLPTDWHPGAATAVTYVPENWPVAELTPVIVSVEPSSLRQLDPAVSDLGAAVAGAKNAANNKPTDNTI
jgi:hypothetical protein